MLQLQSFAKLLENNPDFRDGEKKTCLVLIGSSRNEGDENRIQSLQLAAQEMGIEVCVYAIDMACCLSLTILSSPGQCHL
jgi:hypothetical protein